MKELSIFIDESGDFGEYDHHSPYYIITMVFHDQQEDIQPAVSKLNQELSYLNLNNLCIHTGPIIEKKDFYTGKVPKNAVKWAFFGSVWCLGGV